MEYWSINRTTYKVSDFILWQKTGSLALSPSFQRRPVWSTGAKSLLIDTICRGLPIPVLFLRELKTSLSSLSAIREVVDGQQRIRTVISFVAPNLLSDLNEDRDIFTISSAHNKSISKTPFDKLDSRTKQRILDYQFGVNVFPSDTDDREILQIFARMNSTGTALNHQELRNAEFFGEFKTLMYKVAAEQLERWRSWELFSEQNIARMDEVELTSELYQLIIFGITARSKSSLDNVYRNFDSKFPHAHIATSRFHHVMDTIDDYFGSDVRNYFKRRPLFYCLFAAIYDVIFGLNSDLKRVRTQKLSSSMAKYITEAGIKILNNKAPDSVLEAAARRTTHASSRKSIIKYLTPIF
jgi:hypothetical protein